MAMAKSVEKMKLKPHRQKYCFALLIMTTIATSTRGLRALIVCLVLCLLFLLEYYSFLVQDINYAQGCHNQECNN